MAEIKGNLEVFVAMLAEAAQKRIRSNVPPAVAEEVFVAEEDYYAIPERLRHWVLYPRRVGRYQKAWCVWREYDSGNWRSGEE